MNEDRINALTVEEPARIETSGSACSSGKKDNESVTNVYNATVNNTNVFYSTMACINYMRENRKALIVPAVIMIAVLTMLGVSIVSLNRSIGMYAQAQTLSSDTINKMNDLTERNEQLEKAVNEALESSKKAVAAADEAKKQAENSVSSLSGVTDKELADNNSIKPDDTTAYLNKMTIVSNHNAKKEKSIKNSLGDELKDVVVVNGYGGGYVTYYLGGKFTKFKGNVCCPEDHSITKTYPLTIYANDDPEQELYNIKFGRNTAVTPVELDVTGVEFLTFRVSIDTVLGNYAGVVISEGVLE